MSFTGADPAERTLWLVRDANRRVVDGTEPDPGGLSAALLLPTERESAEELTWRNQSWLVRQQWIRPGDVPGAPRAQAPNPADPHRFPSLVLTAAVSIEPNQATLRRLALALGGLSVVVWLIAAFVGRSVCRRGLGPVSRMAAAARDMSASDLTDRLPRVANGDELDDLSQSFNGLLDRLQESFERQRRFTGDASHQLRTPLTAILGQLEVALRRERSAEEYRAVLATVHEKAGRLQHIVESLLFLARADSDALLPEREPTDLADWLPEHLRTWASHPRTQDLMFENSGGPCFAWVQPAMLGELVDILIDNACKYSAPGSPIRVSVFREGERVAIDVRDGGCGIAADDLPFVFTPFFRSADARRDGIAGLGLGLAIGQRLAAALGGELTVSSQPGEGSRFRVAFAVSETSPLVHAAATL